jgi:HSP20 family protein
MASQPELPVQQKREVEKKSESTIPSRTFLPITDIFETDQASTVILEMPGVDKENVDVNVENDILTIEGRIDCSKYEGLQPVYTEYNIGHYVRSFQVSSKLEQGKISAELNDGVMTLVLLKAEKAKPRKIKVSRRNEESWRKSGLLRTKLDIGPALFV